MNPVENKEGETKLQTVLKQKLGDGAVPFTLQVFKFQNSSFQIIKHFKSRVLRWYKGVESFPKTQTFESLYICNLIV